MQSQIRYSKLGFVVLVLFAAFAAGRAAGATPGLHLTQGMLAGEPSSDGAILQTRLGSVAVLTDGDVPGAEGLVRFEIANNARFERSWLTDWLHARAENDFIVKTRVRGLEPQQTYFYRAHFGLRADSTRRGAAAQFRTLPAPDSTGTLRFVMLSCMHYARFFGQMPDAVNRQLAAADRAAGYPALDVIRTLVPDFWISNGDNVYYDHPRASSATEIAAMRRKWHEQAVLPRLTALHAAAAVFYLKDDHDFRFDDADLTGTRRPVPDDGIRIFREQVPIIDPLTPDAPTYRTVRVNRDVQLWFLEGRDYRSSNRMPDGPDKTLWGTEQRAWLQRTLKASDATFKFIVSPTPLVGPDDARKRDNHTNFGGFRHEGDAFFAWLQSERFDPERLFILTGDRHWKYHSVHPTGFHEWACGAIHVENARAGRAPGDPRSTDPESTIRQLHRDDKADGGFLVVEVSRVEGKPQAGFSLRNEEGVPVHRFQFRVEAPEPFERSEAQWRRHIIDDTSAGADGARLADFNGDKLLDIVTGWEEGGLTRVYLNPGPRQVRQPWPAITIGETRSVEDAVSVDLDGDNRLDVVSSSEGKVESMSVHWAPESADVLQPAPGKQSSSLHRAVACNGCFACPCKSMDSGASIS